MNDYTYEVALITATAIETGAVRQMYGDMVVANKEVLDKQIHSQFRHTAGLDMEAYGIAYAAENATAPRPESLIIKSISDFADSHKNDQYQKFAAYTSAEFAKLLYEKYLPLE